MRKKIAILGSTGSIGKNLLKIINMDNKNFKIYLLSANKNYLSLYNQAKKFKVTNLIITDKKSFILLKKITKKTNIRVFNNFEDFDKIFKTKIDYTMSAITGIDGLIPTINIIKFTKNIAIANKEAIICGWNLIFKELNKNKTKFIPVDSEHFSIWYGILNNNKGIKKIYLTASGGPFLDLPLNKFNKIKISQALKHPNWKMGKKITIDSATMMNKVFEVIEAKNIFNISYDKISILSHPQSYIHAIIKFNNGLIKLIAHDTDMKIPIFNTLYRDQLKSIKSKKINFEKLNNLRLKLINIKKFPSIKILNILPKKNSLFETVVVSANDELVNLFLNNDISFTEIVKKLFIFIKKREFIKYKKKYPKNVNEIVKLSNYVRLKINTKSI